VDQGHHLIRRRHCLVGRTGDVGALRGDLTHIEVGVRRVEQVLDLLVVDLDVLHRQPEVHLLVALDQCEQVDERQRDDAGMLQVAHHRKRLAGAGGAVGKAARVVALDGLDHERLVGFLVHLGLRRVRTEGKVEAVLLGLCLVHPEVVQATHFVVWVVGEHVCIVHDFHRRPRLPRLLLG